MLVSNGEEQSARDSAVPPTASLGPIAIPPTPTLTVAEIKEKARSDISYDSLARSTEQYVGHLVQYSGKVIQVIEHSPHSYSLRVDITKGDYDMWDDTVLVRYEGPRLLEDDIVHFWGRVKGRRTYTTVLGAEVTLPEIEAVALERR